ncbi:MAG: hypothetical protein JOZ42_00405 [Acetobacteraceae bacterium]|nr:hypothetical protein [Acetobacteraceae bacterium]
MVSYPLDHLTQPDPQVVGGPIQDDEALFLFAIIRGMRLRRILEVGGLHGYSATNFLRAVGPEGIVYTIDIEPVPPQAPNHRTIRKDVALVTADDLGSAPLDLLFFDAHSYVGQTDLLHRLTRGGVVTDATVIALHDTNLHPSQFAPWAYPVEDGWVHQDAERRMVNDLRRMGYDAFCLHTRPERHDESLPFRHGITVLQKQKTLQV